MLDGLRGEGKGWDGKGRDEPCLAETDVCYGDTAEDEEGGETGEGE